ncbi:SseB family protein [Lipingzhangella sp. LS1_29]|uniref:SseB family protein n=1 Tax=Lipingzhangella rawalii TaxID=2055835 RepID=A0ABU2H1A2_9ACTN|nr:SseB family protein [Lipingzhangella rawalii]MDS1268772.1 SseB family protein [Lipingzhangella rawalii]
MTSSDSGEPTDNPTISDGSGFPVNDVEVELGNALAAGNAAADATGDSTDTAAAASGGGEAGTNTAEAPDAAGVAGATASEASDATVEAVSRFLGVLRQGELWLPLPEGTGQQEDGSVALPTLQVRETTFVPAFTSEEQFNLHSAELPRARLAVRDLTSALPEGIGLVLNPGNEASVPVYPAMVDTIRDDEGHPEHTNGSDPRSETGHG